MFEFEKNKLKAFLGKELYSNLKDYKCIVAGGTITSLFCNREVNDVDVYFRSKKDISDFILEVVKDSCNMWIVAQTKKSLSLKSGDKLIQLICFNVFDTAEDIFNTFDFTVCMGAYDFKTEEFVLHEDFLKHNSQRLLMFNNKTAYPIVSSLRVDKYRQKGYTISKTEYLRVILTCMDLDISNYDDLKEQLGGMYGVDYDDVIKPLEGEKLNLTTVIEKMSEIVNHPDYFKPYHSKEFEVDNWFIFISSLLGEKIKAYSFRNELYTYNKEDGFEKIKEKDLKCMKLDIKPLDDFFKSGLYVYKNVNKVDGRLISNWDKDFEYKIGEYAVSRGKSWGDREVGLYVLPTIEITKDHCYNNREDSVIIELKLDSVDDFLDLESFTIRKALTIKEVK